MILIAACSFLAQGLNLLERSSTLFEARGWTDAQVYGTGYRWLGPNQLLFENDKPLLDYRGDVPRKPCTLFDISSRKLTDPSELNLAAKRNYLSSPQPSPDGAFILWKDQRGYAAPPPSWVITDLKGHVTAKWLDHAPRVGFNRDEYALARWTADSKSVIESTIKFSPYPSQILMWDYSLADPLHPVAYPAVHGPRQTYEGAPPDFADLGNGRMGWIPPQLGPDVPDTFEIYSLRPGEEDSWTATTFHVPSPWRHDSVEFSPDGKRILWRMERDEGKTNSLWTSWADGSHFQEIGEMTVDSLRTGRYFGYEQWVPGRNAISYVFKGKLYEVDASE